eukprot:CAMPEP_0171658094 /NCGR_PEP_ID=MMETSP0990-20121206/42709_1 /TAXON_ID=483369 /ORGANISM="non described non described, Strain CCMP2098" /LENGTH=58 /DNA_ID=CAMNT_0012239167 /DNA_START=79 /DNA_END=255 /DNA_ORIENTATION=+
MKDSPDYRDEVEDDNNAECSLGDRRGSCRQGNLVFRLLEMLLRFHNVGVEKKDPQEAV